MNAYIWLCILLGENLIFRQQDKYKLIKKNKYIKCKILEAPNKNTETKNLKDTLTNEYMNYFFKDLEQNNNDIEIPKNIKTNINNFFEILSQNFSEEQLKYIKKNLDTLKYKEKKGLLMTLLKQAGTYSVKKHEISINNLLNKKDFNIGRIHIYLFNLSEEQNKAILNHELLHAITTFEGISGFSQGNIGSAINEGYTELINKKIFFNETKEKDYFKSIGYPYEYRIAKIIELIIGEDKMQNLYLNADLNGLINELSKYQDRNKIIQFIKDTDDATKVKLSNFANKEEIYSILNIRIQKFLYDTYSNKFYKEVNYKNIAEYLENQNIFQEELDKINKTKKIIKKKK